MNNNKSPFRSTIVNGDRPAPILVRVPSRRYQRMGIPDGSDGNYFFCLEPTTAVQMTKIYLFIHR